MAALHGRGSALLRAGRRADAINSFERALTLYADNGPALLGLALARGYANIDVPSNLERTRPIEAALVHAQICASRHDAAGAAATLAQLLDTAPPGLAGWTIPVEPAFKDLQQTQAFAAILTRFKERAR